MTDGRVERRLAAVLAADVVGYSRLMGTDEVGTHEALKVHRREVLDPAIAAHHGRIVKSTGDGLLAEFASAVDAVTCAMDVQGKMAERNRDAASKIVFRIGINVGDIIIEPDDIFGDGVNVAVRVEGECEPGGVCLSDDAFRQVRGKTAFAFDDLGEKSLKNIDRPIRIYAARSPATISASLPGETGSPLPLPDRPSIAVLPFQNMSDDARQEYFADGLVEDIIAALSRFRGLFVIARNSSFTYKGKAVDIKQVGRELGVRYVLEGSVRRAGTRLRISGQLIDVTSGAHLWADRFDGSLDDMFELQDKLTQEVVAAIAPEVDRAEIGRASRRPVGNVDAVTEFYRGLPHINFPSTSANNDAALGHFQNAMTYDPGFAPAYGGVAACLAWRRANGWPHDRDNDDSLLLRVAARVRETNTDDAFTLNLIGFALFYNNVDHDGGIEMVERAIQSNPNVARAYAFRGFLRVWDGGSDNAIADFEKALRLSPRDPLNFNAMIGLAFGYYNAGRFAEAATLADRSIRAFPPNFISGMLVAVMCYVGANRLQDARRLLAQCVQTRPNWRRSTVDQWPWHGVRSPELRAKMLDALVQAGLPD